ncbi:hypothetical protein [Micromonospora thermarum]|uniref:DUF4276 family protein n=1 Tax=Micromonospora thermarum TaxID=2720024 RepID=A0ABX0Z721_9ACTN|nr:hypothetical protein [Micromonospora thermarum]NJP31926.1 hypothetical protein [Micromonospora thermarum]
MILGEDDNDRKAVQVLVAALRPDIPRGALKPLRKPMALVRNVPPQRLPSQANKAGALLRAVNVKTPIRAVLMHEDADEVEPAHETLITKIESSYRSLPWPVLAVVPAWEMETWWFLFPDAVAAVRPTWRRPDQFAGRDVGRIRNAKEELKKAVTPQGARQSFQTYTEADSVAIAEKVVALGQLTPPWFARSASWAAFLDKIGQL